MTVHLPIWLVWIAQWFVSALALALTAALIPGFRIRGFGTALIASLVLGILNIFVTPVLQFLAIPFTILTLGFFIFVVDAIVLRICAALLDDFEISNWFSAILGAIVLAFANSLLHYLII
jgi:putative membrane protein